MYYRVAIQEGGTSTWKWKSTVLNSLNSLILWLQDYRILTHHFLYIFSSSSPEELSEQLVRENQELGSTSVPAIQFLQERGIAPREVRGEALAGRTPENARTPPIASVSELSLAENSASLLDKRREELERGAGGDHDIPYRFTLPTMMPQALAWVKLLGRVQQSDLQSEVLPEEEQQPSRSEGYLSVRALQKGESTEPSRKVLHKETKDTFDQKNIRSL